MTGYVYAISNGAGRVKIGYSESPASRLVKIRADNPHRCVLLGYVSATLAQEAEAHALLAPWRVAGEWFDETAHPVAVFCDMLRGRGARAEPEEPANALEEYFRATGENAFRLASRMGVAPTTLTRPLRGERNASMDTAIAVERATGGKVTAAEFMAICLVAKMANAGAPPTDEAA